MFLKNILILYFVSTIASETNNVDDVIKSVFDTLPPGVPEADAS